eukprot:GHVQ01024212.1.p1 GENE.GHVQ01024212.1~~GHVQ01024212.1.p1  ORF type:complete len:206 (+),score=24.38 GHVQ01024212.1:699-1316(+)
MERPAATQPGGTGNQQGNNVKVILLGDSAVGKSKLVERYLLDDYNPRHVSTYALTLYQHKAFVDGVEYNVDIWDTAGQEQFDNLHASYYYNSNACIMVFDVTRKVTYKNLEKWYQELQEYCPDIPCIVVANKIDSETNVTSRQFNFASSHNLPLHFVSASDGTNVIQVFEEGMRLAIQNKLNPPDDIMAEMMDLLGEDYEDIAMR